MITEKQALQLIEAISVESDKDEIYYKISHCFNNSCQNSHEDWKKEIELLYNEIIWN